MYYELYIDVFFLENFMMDSILLLIINRVMNNGRPPVRIFLGGFAGSLLTCLAIAVSFPPAVRTIIFHTLVSSAMILSGLRIKRLSQFIQAVLLLYAAAVMTGGIMQIFRPYMRYVSLFYAAGVFSNMVFLQLWRLIAHMYRKQSRILQVTLYTDRGGRPVKALLDTGNELRDCYTGEPVNIIDPETAAAIADHMGAEKGFHMIPYHCISGESVMKVFRVKKMCVHMEEEKWIENPLLGIGEKSLSGDEEYEMILNPAIFSG